MPPHHHHHHGGGGGGRRGGWGMPYPVPFYDGGGTTVVVEQPQCIGYDNRGRPMMVPCDLAVGASDVPAVSIINKGPEPKPRSGMIRSGFNIANGVRPPRGGSTPYYRFAAQARSYPFDWHSNPGGVPYSRVAAESRGLGSLGDAGEDEGWGNRLGSLGGSALGGSGDLYESGLEPNTLPYPPLAHRGFRLKQPGALGSVWSELSQNEQRLAMGAGLAGLAFLAYRHLKKRRRR